jgi:uncharacterized protein
VRHVQPVVWVLCSDAAGGDGQSFAIADALGWLYSRKYIKFKSRQRGIKKYFGRWGKPNLRSVDLGKSAPLEPPWPDLVIGAGRRQVPVELWLKEKSGGKARLVHVELPIAPVQWFDLVIGAGYPDGPKTIEPQFPIMRKPVEPNSDYLDFWKKELAHLPKPWISLFVGGPAYAYVMDAGVVSDLLSRTSAYAVALSGSLLISTSRRTPTSVLDVVRPWKIKNSYVEIWEEDKTRNPYQAMLALSDRVIVTCDSASMVMETLRAGKKPEIYELPQHLSFAKQCKPSTLFYKSFEGTTRSGTGILARKLLQCGLIDHPGHVQKRNAELVAKGYASVFGRYRNDASQPPFPDELDLIVGRIQRWFPYAK